MSLEAVTLADIASADWSLKLGAIGSVVQGIADVDQCVAIILTTPKGSDPLRPTFGCDIWRYIDHPVDEAFPAIVREVTEALTLWEPRLTLVNVTSTPLLASDLQAAAHLSVAVTWQLKLSGAPSPIRTTVITLPAQSL